MECAHSRHWKIREMAAKSLPNLIDCTRYMYVIRSIITSINPMGSLNYQHGCALQISNLMQGLKNCEENARTLSEFFLELEWLFNSRNKSVGCTILVEAIYNFLYDSEYLNIPSVNSLKRMIAENCYDFCLNAHADSELMHMPSQYYSVYATIVCQTISSEKLNHLILFSHRSIAIQLISSLIDSKENNHLNVAGTCISLFTTTTDPKLKQACVYFIAKSIDILDHDQALKLYQWICTLNTEEIEFKFLEAIFHILSHLISISFECSIKNNLLSKFLTMAKKWIGRDCPMFLRVSLAKCIKLIVPNLDGQLSLLTMNFFQILDSLLCDDISAVRDASIECISVLLKTKVLIIYHNSRFQAQI